MYKQIKNIFTAYRTTPVETSLNYIDQQSNIKIPVSNKMTTDKALN
jgi:hypothetical protein